MQLDVESVRTFIAVLDHGGMTAAAKALGLSQSAVSWKIKRLEERVGRDLLIRDGRRLTPTHDGRELLDYGRAMVALHDDAVARLLATPLEGAVRLGTTEEASALAMGAVCARFSRIHPDATLDFVVDRSVRLAAMLDRGEIDVAIIQLEPHEARATDRPLWSDRLRWICSPDWTYDEGTVPLITFGEDGFYRPIAEAALDAASIRHRVAYEGTSTAGVLSAAAAGFGVALLGSRSVNGSVVDWPRAAALPEPPGVVNVVRTARGARSEITRALVDDIRAEMGEIADTSRP